MNKIHSTQLFAILMLSAAWSVLCLPEIGSSTMLISCAVMLAVLLILSVPMLLLTAEGFSLSQAAARKKWLGLLYIIYFLLWGANGFSQFWEVSSVISLPVSGSLTAAVLMVAACLYTCSLGLKAMARCAPFVLGLLGIAVVVLIIGAYSRTDITRLVPEHDGIWRHCLTCFSMCGELTAAFVLLDRTKGSRRHAVWGYLTGRTLLMGLVIFLCICAAGRLAGLEPYPFFTLTALSQPLQSQRADALYILVFVMLFVMHITLQTGVIAHLMQAMFPKLKGAAPVSLAVMLLLSWSLPLREPAVQMIGSILLLLTAFAVPFLLYLFRRYPHEKTRNSPPAPPAADGVRNGAHQ